MKDQKKFFKKDQKKSLTRKVCARCAHRRSKWPLERQLIYFVKWFSLIFFWFSLIFNWFSLIFIVFSIENHCFFIGFHRFSLVFIGLLRFFIGFHWFWRGQWPPKLLWLGKVWGRLGELSGTLSRSRSPNKSQFWAQNTWKTIRIQWFLPFLAPKRKSVCNFFKITTTFTVQIAICWPCYRVLFRPDSPI